MWRDEWRMRRQEKPIIRSSTLRHLTRDLAEGICLQCHLQGDVEILVRGKRGDDYRPGLRIEDFRLQYRLQSGDARMDVAGHSEQLHLSPCYQKSESLTCTTCHQLHSERSETSADEQNLRYNAVCRTCHQIDSCAMPQDARPEISRDNCIRCHMPKTPTRVSHVAFTNHTIGVSDAASPQRGILIPLQNMSRLSKPDREMSRGLAMLNIYLRQSQNPAMPTFRAQAKRALISARQNGLNDPRILSGLALIALDENDWPLAEAVSRQALRVPTIDRHARLDAGEVLSEICLTQKRLKEAERWLRDLTANHRNPRHWLMLGDCLRQQQKFPEAVKAFERAIEIAPADAAPVHWELAALYEQLGKEDLANQHENLARSLSTIVP